MRYKAFISYSHAADDKLAPALQSGLQRFAKRWNQLRALRAFRDKTGLSANPGLWSAIESALIDSEFFLLLASPAAARSVWVRKEVQRWLELGRANRLLLVLTEGDIVWNPSSGDVDWSRSDALPETLQGRFAEEPLYTDLRWARTEEHVSLENPRFRESVADLASTLHGIPKDDLDGEHVRQHKKLVRLTRAAVAALLVLSAAAVTAAVIAYVQRNEARTQAQIALARQLAAQSEAARIQKGELLPYSVLLAVESMKRYPSVEADQALRNGLALLPRPLAAFPHEDDVVAVAFHPNGNLLATASWDGAGRLWSLGERKLVATLGHGKRVSSVAFSADGGLVATGGWDGNARIWNGTTGQPAGGPFPVKGYVVVLAFSPDGRLLAAVNQAGSHGNLNVWDVASGQTLQALDLSTAGSSNARGLSFSKDGKLATTSRADVRVWNVASWKEFPVLKGQRGEVLRVQFSPDATVLAAAAGGVVHAWDANTWSPITSFSIGDRVTDLAFSTDGRYLAAGAANGEAGIWETTSGKESARVRHELGVTAVAIGPDGSLFATSSEDRTAAVWEVIGGRKRATMVHGGRVLALAFSIDGQRLATAGADKTTRVWEAGGAAEVARIPFSDAVDDMAFSPRQGVFVARENQVLGLWRGTSGRAETRGGEGLRSLAVCATGELAASSRRGDVVRVWELDSGREIASLTHPGEVDWEEHERHVRERGLSYRDPRATITQRGRAEHSGTVEVVGFSAEGRYLLTTRADFQARVWDVATGTIIVAEPHEFSVDAAAFSPDGRFLALVEDGDVFEVLDLQNRSKVVSFKAEKSLAGVEISSDARIVATEVRGEGGRTRVQPWDSSRWEKLPPVELKPAEDAFVLGPGGLLAVAGRSGTARVLTLPSGTEVASVAHDGEIQQIVFSPDGKLLATTGADETVRVLEIHARRELARMPHQEQVYSALFAPDGRHLATRSQTTARIFALPQGREVARMYHAGPVQRLSFTPDGKYLATASAKSTIEGPSARLWLWKPLHLIDEACARLTRHIPPTQWSLLFSGERYRKTCPKLAE